MSEQELDESNIDIKSHMTKTLSDMLLRFTVASTIYFFTICILFSVSLVRLSATENDLRSILINQNIILTNQANSAKERTKLAKAIVTHTADFKTIIHALDGVNISK